VVNREMKLNRERNLSQARNQPARNQSNRPQAAQAKLANAARQNFAANRGRNVTLGTNHVANYRGRNVTIVNNWQQPRFSGNANYSAFYNYANYANWHDRSWWNNHYSNVVFVLGGWWYWDAGYWYPAWGYDPYASYVYAGPIYTGSAELTPHEIVANVQAELSDWDYDPGPVDGMLGPQTREALSAFQADHGLLVTSAIDRPTLRTLGLT
jgi:Putative peptidoglycan binding domain